MADKPARSKNPVKRALKGQEPIMTFLVVGGSAVAGAYWGLEIPAEQILAGLGIASPFAFAAVKEKVVPAVDVKETKVAVQGLNPDTPPVTTARSSPTAPTTSSAAPRRRDPLG